MKIFLSSFEAFWRVSNVSWIASVIFDLNSSIVSPSLMAPGNSIHWPVYPPSGDSLILTVNFLIGISRFEDSAFHEYLFHLLIKTSQPTVLCLHPRLLGTLYSLLLIFSNSFECCPFKVLNSLYSSWRRHQMPVPLLHLYNKSYMFT